METSLPLEPSIESSSKPKEDPNQVKALLSEARNTRDMLVGFRAAVEAGTFHGSKMMDLAKGMAFMEAILKQNQAHLKNLQDRLETK